MNEKELFENMCFLPSWTDCELRAKQLVEAQDVEDPLNASNREWDVQEAKQNYLPQRKDLSTLLAELEEIKNNIENIKAKEWHLAKLIKFHKEGVAFQ